MSIAQLFGLTPDGFWNPVAVGPYGNILQEAPQNEWNYAAASGGITDTNAVTLVAAAGVGKVNYLTSLQMKQTSATATEVAIKDVATGATLFLVKLPASMITADSFVFPTPLKSSANSALTATCGTGSTVTYVNAQGYSEGSPQQAQVAETGSFGQGDQLFDDSGNNILDDSSNVIYLN